jgi:hypothetical protein
VSPDDNNFLGRILAADFGFDVGEELILRLIFVAGGFIARIAERFLDQCLRRAELGIAINISFADPAGERINRLAQPLLLPAWVCCEGPSHTESA